MAYVQFETPDIEIRIPAIEIGETVINRMARLASLIYNRVSRQVSITWTVMHYSVNADGSNGEYLPFIPNWSKTSVADNTTMCDVTNGFPIEKIEVGQDAEGQPIMDYDPAINYTGQYDFFHRLAEYQPVLIHQMIIQFGNNVKSWEKQ